MNKLKNVILVFLIALSFSSCLAVVSGGGQRYRHKYGSGYYRPHHYTGHDYHRRHNHGSGYSPR